MAAHIARCCIFLCGNVRTRFTTIPQQVKPRRVQTNQLNNILQPNAGYANRGTDNNQGVQVLVPVDRLTVSYSRSSGPGGQHVNKVNTKTEIRFHVLTADWIPEDVRQKIMEKNKNRTNKAGELIVTSELSRSQHRNFNDCIQKISAVIAEASEKPHEATPEDIALWKSRLDNRNKERIRQKKIHSATKQSRRLEFD
ncbi:peptidyl-tRNA hydrolase ICT1, mitochondrial-like isoform X1 [Hippocampus zosterae]|uniref:peptidyl-tRNA hydrolase ICT1, mitochondrial-like isoform X1 n=1 Tax=Hippocampus zosterae TaxID=109293 RepID=UPI00223D657C|nr:peptidyl-tRNA hydrolase ICT1, mitochondrial-like isoform X1 [Hippocampus zosterae]XP_051927260.1 peptidyl-tRNA hydrolase ICT1, mitochondrial-like isoform X1 [Hippocampus zosterae]